MNLADLFIRFFESGFFLPALLLVFGMIGVMKEGE